MKVAKIQDNVLIDFIDKIHGKKHTCLITRKPNVVFITRSSQILDYEMRKEYYNYVFQDELNEESVRVNFRDAEGYNHDISDEFAVFMNTHAQSQQSEESEMADE